MFRKAPVMFPKAPDPEVVAELMTIVGNVPDLKLMHRMIGGGVEIITVEWPGREITMEKLVDDAVWSAFDQRLDDAIGTGPTPADALRAALRHA